MDPAEDPKYGGLGYDGKEPAEQVEIRNISSTPCKLPASPRTIRP